MGKGIGLSRVGVYAQNHQFAAGFFWWRAAKEEVMGGSIDSAPADWLKEPAGFVCV